MSLAFNIIRAANLMVVPWKNGGGATREIAASPKGAAFDAFDWRVSVADISVAGAFSVFEGIDRVLMLIEGEQMVLIDSAEGRPAEYVLSRWDSVAFAGESSISVELPHGPTRDFNLMLRRDRVSGNVTVRRLAEQLDVARGSVVLVCARGEFAVSGERLSPGDAIVVDASENGALSVEPLSEDAVLIDARIVSKDPGHGRR
jgi:environmental stress-induced protein Ves